MPYTTILVYVMIYGGSALMVYNIVRFHQYKNYAVKAAGKDLLRLVLDIPELLLILFLAGYLAIGLFGEPDLVVAAILLGGSIFVTMMLYILWTVTRQIADNEAALSEMYRTLNADFDRQREELEAALASAEKANAAKTVFLSNMSHDLRTPMNAILGYASLAQAEGISREEMKSHLSRVEAAGGQLLAIINDVLEMSRIESGHMELSPVPTCLPGVMEEMRALFAGSMSEKGLRFEVNVEPLRDPCVLCDKNRLNRILLNLLSNALKFTPSGGAVLTELRQIEGGEDGKGCYEFHVRDTGIGMTREFSERVFNVFERERNATVSGIQGTGLGMAITKSIVDLMGGTIDLVTAPGEGTTFTIRLCFPACDSVEMECDRGGEPVSEVSIEGMRLLVVDDMEINRELAGALLDDMGCVAEAAVNGEEAVRAVAKAPPGYFEAVLMDIQMPVMDGYEAARRIRSLADPVRAGVPILAVTANAFSEDQDKARAAGMDGHVSKPINPEELRMRLAQIRKREREKDENRTEESDQTVSQPE